MDEYGKSSFGFDENIVAAASYFGPLGLLVYLKEKKSNFARFHSAQSIMGFGALLLFWVLVTCVPFLAFLRLAPGLFAFIFSLFMMLKSYDGEEYKLPIIGSLAFLCVYETGQDLLSDDTEE
ncbi:MAG: DUF4870 domain-containing protein [Armatimonadota bacterium]